MLSYEQHSKLYENVNTNHKYKLIELFKEFINNEDMYSDDDFIKDLSVFLDSVREEYNDYGLIVKIKFYKSDVRKFTIDDIIDMLTSTNQNYDTMVDDINLAIQNPENVELTVI